MFQYINFSANGIERSEQNEHMIAKNTVSNWLLQWYNHI
ncbi:hypothetical protein STFR1_10007 [Bacillus vallismortis]